MSMTGNRIGISSLVSYALYVGIGISAVGLMIALGTPIIGSLQDSSAYENMLSEMQSMDETVRSLTGQGQGAQIDHSLEINRGSMRFVNQSLRWTVESTTEPIAAGQNTRIGTVNVTAEALPDDQNRITIIMSYEQDDQIMLQGFNGTLGQGLHELTFHHEGIQDDQVLIRVER